MTNQEYYIYTVENKVNGRLYVGQTVSESTKNKIRASNLGERNPMYGRKHSEESRLKMSIAASERVARTKKRNK